ncbi:MAG TPA: SRPBCC family protein, partial [Actinopolymorphaceae bacterium]|nr:SRPBCC family protein [Actinopolymorphaceae bacterium]
MSESLRTVDGRQVLRIERRLPHSPQKVWRAVTEPAHLSQWYPFRAEELDLSVGGRIRFDDGQGTSYDAVVTALDPPRLFAFSEHPPPVMTRESDDLIQFELRPDGDGCVLVFTHVFDDRPAAASYATGWFGCLAALEPVLDGKPAEWPPMSVRRYESYVQAFGLAQGVAETTDDGWVVRYERQLMSQPPDRVWATL